MGQLSMLRVSGGHSKYSEKVPELNLKFLKFRLLKVKSHTPKMTHTKLQF